MCRNYFKSKSCFRALPSNCHSGFIPEVCFLISISNLAHKGIQQVYLIPCNKTPPLIFLQAGVDIEKRESVNQAWYLVASSGSGMLAPGAGERKLELSQWEGKESYS